MTVLSLREYESVPVHARLSGPSERALSYAELDHLYALSKRLNIPLIEQTSRDRVRCKQYIGVVTLGERTLELLPKIEQAEGDSADSVVRHNLLKMVLTAFDLEAHWAGEGQVHIQRETWLELLIRLFCRSLADQLRRGVARKYRLENGDLATVRGRILLTEQLRRNLVHQERTACAFDELDANHPLNQLFKYTLGRMLRVSSSASTQQEVRELLPAFECVDDVPPTATWLKGIRTDRLTDRFEFCLKLARIFVSGESPDVTSGSTQAFALLFDMNELFERYIGRVLRQILRPYGYKTELQVSRHYLVRDKETSQRLFQLRPDIVVNDSQGVRCIVDTKWKRLSPSDRKFGISQADLYQMLAYADRYDCDSILLLYPFHHEDEYMSPLMRELVYEGRSTNLCIGQVALGDLKKVPEDLLELFRVAAGAPVRNNVKPGVVYAAA